MDGFEVKFCRMAAAAVLCGGASACFFDLAFFLLWRVAFMNRLTYLFCSLVLLGMVALVSSPSSAQTPVVHYTFEGDATDLAGGDNNGVLNGGVATSAPNLSKVDGGSQSLLLEGTDDYVSITDGVDIVPGGSTFTLATWINLTGNANQDVIYFSNPSGGAAARLIMQIRAASGLGNQNYNITVGGRTQQADGFSRYTATPQLAPGTTYHVAATIDTSLGGANAVQLYVDGEPVGHTLTSGAGFTQNPFDATTGFSATVGANGAPGDFVVGRMDDVRIYTEVLDARQIRSLAVPEPATIALVALGGIAAFVRRRR
jgi:hypothetical protein